MHMVWAGPRSVRAHRLQTIANGETPLGLHITARPPRPTTPWITPTHPPTQATYLPTYLLTRDSKHGWQENLLRLRRFLIPLLPLLVGTIASDSSAAEARAGPAAAGLGCRCRGIV